MNRAQTFEVYSIVKIVVNRFMCTMRILSIGSLIRWNSEPSYFCQVVKAPVYAPIHSNRLIDWPQCQAKVAMIRRTHMHICSSLNCVWHILYPRHFNVYDQQFLLKAFIHPSIIWFQAGFMFGA